MHMVSKKHLNFAELETMRISQTREEATAHVPVN